MTELPSYEIARREDAAKRMPAGTKAVIVAKLVKDESDIMSDYFSSTTTRTVILAFSSHTRDLFPELRKAAAHFPETAHLVDAPESAEHREKYSMGGGYYLKDGYRHSSGWSVRKIHLGDRGAADIPVGEWCLSAPVAASAPEPSAPKSTGAARIEQHTHTKRGFQMWIVVLADRVEREEFDRLRDNAESFGGWYSRPWGTTPGGFAFKEQAKAEQFAAALSGPRDLAPREPSACAADLAAPSVPPKSAASPDTGAKLRALADKMGAELAGNLGDRLANTPKRRREADAARIEGRRLQRTQQALRALADCHTAGTVPAELRTVTSKAAVYDLVGTIIDMSHSGYYDAGIDTDKPAKDSAAALAIWKLIGARSEADRKADELRRMVADLQFANIPGYFPTPAPVVAQMIEAAGIERGQHLRVLEPEAGSGAILDALRDVEPWLSLGIYETSPRLREVLKAKGYDLTGSDFLAAEPSPTWDRVIMNPPFENGQDIEHVRHAHRFLAPNGRLVAIMSPGPFYRQDKKAAAFRDWFDEMGGDRVDLPAGAFKESGTGVATVLVTIPAA